MSLVTEIEEASLTQTLSATPSFVLLDLWAPWCAPCRTLTPVLKRLAATFGHGLQIAKLDVERYPDAMTRFGVRGIPTLLLFKDGTEVDRSVGVKSQTQLSEWLLGAGVPQGAETPTSSDAPPNYPAFYGDASLQGFLWQRLEDAALSAAGRAGGGR